MDGGSRNQAMRILLTPVPVTREPPGTEADNVEDEGSGAGEL